MPNFGQYPPIAMLNQQRLGSQSCYSVMTHDNKIYKFIVSLFDSDLYYVRSDDGGYNWQLPVSIFTGTVGGVSVWYDRWTPGNTGDLIHIAYVETAGGHDCLYRNLNTSNNTLGTQTTIFAGTSAVANSSMCVSITRAIGGNLYCAVDIDGGTENTFARSVDVGANWTNRTDVHEAASADYYLLAPGFAADNQDIICLYWDRSADEISRKLYDDSANTWGETSIATGMVESSTVLPNFAMTVDDLNNKILMPAWSAVDGANADLRIWSIDESSITELTPVVSNGTDDQGMCGISIDPVTNYITVYYGGKSDGSETFNTAIHIYFKVSRDGGTTWGAETQLSTSLKIFDWIQGCPVLYWGGYPMCMVDFNGGFVQMLFRRGARISPRHRVGS